MGLTLVTAPDGEPVVPTEAINHLRLEEATEEDALVASLVKSSREFAEGFTNRALITQTWKLTLDCFPTTILLPKPPLQSVVSIKYTDTAGVEQTVSAADYQVDITSEPGRVVPAWGKYWPTTRGELNAVRITFTCGYGDAASVPEAIKQAVLLMVGGGYENRESIITGTIVDDNPAVKSLLWAHRYVEAG